MNKLTESMIDIIRIYNVGSVASINDDGSPAVSPKGTFVVINKSCIAYGNIRSPGTSANLKQRPDTEVMFLDILARTALRIQGQATIVDKNSEAGLELAACFEKSWGDYLSIITEFVSIDINQIELVTSPGYDLGLTREELTETNLNKLQTWAESS